MLAEDGYEHSILRPSRRQPSTAEQSTRLEASGSKHWPISVVKQIRYCVCLAKVTTDEF